ncbi:MAG: ATP-binding protein [Vicinamibacterales bacterium]
MHRLLERQIRRHLETADVTTGPWPAFLEAVDRSYGEAESDRSLLESAMEISSQELLQANAELRAVVQAFPDLILHLDADGRITSCRGRAIRTFVQPRGGLVGHELRELFAEGERAGFDEALAIARGSSVVTTVSHSSGEHGATVHELRLARAAEGSVVAVVRDVTDARRASEMRLAKEGAEAASRAKSAFLANMSHELRTPLNAILGYSEMLAEEAPAEMREDLDRIHRSGRHLLQVLNSMLDIARIEAGMARVEVDAVDVSLFVADTCSLVRPLAEAKALTLVATVAPDAGVVHSDRAKLLQILQQLASNAVKFTDRGQVEIGAVPETIDRRPGVRIAVRDTGIGIRADQRSRLFQDFAQIDDSTTRRFGGTGLGLALCRRLSGLLGGSVAVESTFGAGSTFSVWVPRHLPPAPVSRPAAAGANGAV